MLTKYNPATIEEKWGKKWEEEGIYKTPSSPGKKKKYVLDMFPYPSSASMHVGHLEGYVGTDILSRYLRMRGYKVLHPMGWDAFGLPAENYAIKTGIHPAKSTRENIKNFKRQLKKSGLSYDWEREIDTSSPEFYKWTQWIFIKMWEKGLVYKKKAPVNWCPKDETVLANEQVVDGKCERCDTPVVQKELEQWFFRITEYAEKLLEGLEKIDWPPEVKVQQTNWIGRSRGMLIEFKSQNSKVKIRVFTTRPDTLNAVTFLATSKLYKEGDREKTGKFSGKYAIDPLSGRKLPIWDTNYVAPDYGTGTIMGVPAHDERDMEFAKKYGIDIVKKKPDKRLWQIIEEKGWGRRHTNYHIRDWLISRQRYWGCPIPMTYCQSCGWQPVAEKELPVLLPTDVDFLPHGESPIARSKSFQKDVVCPGCGKPAKREVDTMDTYVDSSWYFIRFVDPKNKKAFASKKRQKEWLPVDIYVGGGHVVQHLLFARFLWKFLYDAGLIDRSLGDEPFLKLRAPGWILGEDSRKMSKRWENVVTPDDIIPKFGADTLRVYEMFMGPFEVMKPWSMTGVEGASRFLGRVWRLFNHLGGGPLRRSSSEASPLRREVSRVDSSEVDSVLIKLHQTIKKVTEDIENFRYNTAISAIMEFVNLLYEKVNSERSTVNGNGGAHTVHRPPFTGHEIRCAEWDEALKILCLILAPFAPHMAEEVFQRYFTNHQFTSVHLQPWPKYNPELIKASEVTIAIQINGKLRATILMAKDEAGDRKKAILVAKKQGNVKKWLSGKEIRKTVFVPGKIINFVTK